MKRPDRDGFVADFAQLDAEEQELLRQRREARGIAPDEPRFGFALSSGGVRSSAFGLGVIRALHEKGVYARLDYLSMVGGGGFIGAFVNWLRRRESGIHTKPGQLLPDSALRFVRERADFMNPTLGHEAHGQARNDRTPIPATLFGVVLGQMVLSLTVYASLLVGLFCLLHIGDAIVNLQKPILLLVTRNDIWRFCVAHLNFGAVAGLLVLAVGTTRIVSSVLAYVGRIAWQVSVPDGKRPRWSDTWRGSLWLLLGVITGALAITAVAMFSEGVAPLLAGVSCAAISAQAFARARSHWDARVQRGQSYGAAWLLWPLVGALLTTGTLLYLLIHYLFETGQGPVGDPPVLGRAGGVVAVLVAVAWTAWLLPRLLRGAARALSDTPIKNDPRASYLRSLAFQHKSGTTLAWAAFWLVLGTIPWWEQVAEQALGSRVLHLHVFGSALAFGTLWICLRVVATSRRVRARRLGLHPGVRDGLFVTLLYGLLVLAHGVTEAILDSSLPHLGLFSVLVGLVLGGLAQLNFAGAGRVYRNRLAETFLPDAEALSQGGWLPALSASDFPLSRLGDVDDWGPYPLLNTSLVTDGSGRRKHGQRGSDAFIMSPLYCGSASTGWAATRRWLGGNLTVSDALAVSSAATAPGANLDAHGSERHWLVSVALAVLNLRPYYCVDNPNPRHAPRPSRVRPNLLVPGLRSLLSRADQSEHARHVRLSDGRHFEALGLYELLRRKVELIVVSDATDDADLGFRALGTSLERAREDLGISVTFEPGKVFGSRAETGIYGAVATLGVSARGFAIGTIHYGDAVPAGTLIYIKPALIEGLDVAVQSFATEHARFPHAPSPNRLFDERHFVAYEQLGHQIALRALDEGLARESAHLDSIAPPRYDSFIQLKGGAPAKTGAAG